MLTRTEAFRGAVADPEAVIAALNPVAWYKFDEGAGATAADSSGNGFDLTSLIGSWITGGYDFGTSIYLAPAGVTAAALSHDGANPKTMVVAAKAAQVSAGEIPFGVEWHISPHNNGERWSFRSRNTEDHLRLEIQGEGHDSALTLSDDAWFVASCKTSGSTLSTGSLSLNGTHEALIGTGVTIATKTTNRLQINSANNVAQRTDLGYLLLFPAALSNSDIDNLRAALIIIMANRGVTLP